MSPQQQRLSGRTQGALDTYRNLSVGNGGWGEFAAFELYNLLLQNLGGALGYGLRRFFLPPFLDDGGRALACGRGVTIRQPGRMEFGRGVIIEDYATLDIRAGDEADDEHVGIELGDHVLIGRHSILTAKDGKIKLGNAVNISSNCRIATQSRIEIGDSVLIAAYAYIGPGNHQVDHPEGGSIIESSMINKGGVKIGAHAWIGTRATILDGVTIGKGAVIGAHSLVTEDVPDNAIVAGTPAKIIRYRKD